MGFETQADKEIIAGALETTDTAVFADRPLSHLSAGERQRVFIARALAQQTPILLLDEPTNFLDFRHQVEILDLLKKMQLENDKTIVAITHDINLAAQYCDRALLLSGDTTYHTGPTQEVFTADRIEKIFAVKTFQGRIGNESFFLPIGKFAKDA
jgi:iron complex transport system ATP-binding protein